MCVCVYTVEYLLLLRIPYYQSPLCAGILVNFEHEVYFVNEDSVAVKLCAITTGTSVGRNVTLSVSTKDHSALG